jgi:hypothetical protein
MATECPEGCSTLFHYVAKRNVVEELFLDGCPIRVRAN